MIFNRSPYLLLQTVLILLVVALPGLAEWDGIGKMAVGPLQSDQTAFRNSTAVVVVRIMAPDLLDKLTEGAACDGEARTVVIKTTDLNFPLKATITRSGSEAAAEGFSGLESGGS